MYYLLNKDSLVGQFDIDESQHKISRQLEHIGTSPLPIGFQNIKSWVENRKASINDTFWVKSDKEDISWPRHLSIKIHLIDDQLINNLELFRQKSLSNALEAVERAYTAESGIEKHAQSERVPSQER